MLVHLKKLGSSACYGKQQVCRSVCNFSR